MTGDRKPETMEGAGKVGPADTTAQILELHCKLVEEGCIECGLCQKDCLFLQRYGSPKQLAGQQMVTAGDLSFSFECSLCGLCTAVCPKKVDPAAMFAAMRVAGQELGGGEFRQHAGLLRYESMGGSPWFSWYGLPEGCDTVFFPGCALAGSRAARVSQTYRHLRTMIPTLGLVLDCCAKPSHDLGRRARFCRIFGALRNGLEARGVRTILVACPSCYRVWSDYGGSIAVRSVYEILAEAPPAHRVKATTPVTVHDPCPTRNDTTIHGAVRSLLAAMGLPVEEMKHHGRKTLCCGEGGAACHLVPAMAGNWTALRADEAAGRRIITYCAGCTNFLGRLTQASHILDLYFAPEQTLAGQVRVTRSPLSWLARLLLQRKAKALVRPAVIASRDREGKILFRQG
jgi:Fe-S oxidoreductase